MLVVIQYTSKRSILPKHSFVYFRKKMFMVARFKSKLKYARAVNGMTQEELAKLVGCTSRHIQGIESGKNQPNYKLGMDIVNQLGLCPFTMGGIDCNDYSYIVCVRKPLRKNMECCLVDTIIINSRLDQLHEDIEFIKTTQ